MSVRSTRQKNQVAVVGLAVIVVGLLGGGALTSGDTAALVAALPFGLLIVGLYLVVRFLRALERIADGVQRLADARERGIERDQNDGPSLDVDDDAAPE